MLDFSHLPSLVFCKEIHVLPNYLLSIIHANQTVIDENPTVLVRGVILDISKALDKVWHDGIII